MNINNRVKIVRSTDLSDYTKDYIGMTGTITEVKEIYPDIKNNKRRLELTGIDINTSKILVIKIDDKFTKKHFCMRADFFTEEVELINTTDDSEPIVVEPIVYINNNLVKGGETFVVFDYIDQSISYKGTIHDIVNDYILPLAVDNEWEDDDIEQALNLKNEDDVRNFLYTNMDTYLQ